MISDETLAKWRREFLNRMMTSAIWEYCPEEFGQLLDEIEILKAQLYNEQQTVKRLSGVRDLGGGT